MSEAVQLYDLEGRHLYLTSAERDAFLDAATKEDRPVRTLCAVLYYTGCRISEALALTPRRVDINAQTVIFESLKKRRRGVYRTVPVPEALIDTLDMVHGIRETHRRKRGDILDAPPMADSPQHGMAARYSRDEGRRHPGGAAPLPEGTQARLRHSCLVAECAAEYGL